MNKLILSLLLTLLVTPAMLAQDADAEPDAKPDAESKPLELPECDIFLFDLATLDDGLSISNPRNITDRVGYDNQPWFTPDSSSVLFTANRKPDRTDVFEYLIESGETKRVTDTPNQEYSPQISPDNQTLSFVTDGATANQSIWKTKRGSGVEEWLLADQGEREPVGYYSWNHTTGYILYWSRYGHSMRLVHESKELSHYVTGNAPPTTPHIIPGTTKFSFMHQQANSEVWIKELDPETFSVRPLVAVSGSNRNYGWTPRGEVVMVDGSELKRWSEGSGEGWQLVADLDEHGLTSVTRVAVSPDGTKLAVVGLPTEQPTPKK